MRFRHPRLPESLDQVVIRQLRVGDSQFDLMLPRYGGDVSVNLLDRRGSRRGMFKLTRSIVSGHA